MKNNLKIIIFFLFFGILLQNNLYSKSYEKVTLQLKWFHQFQFAGYYAAKEKGFYKDVGLDVEIKERDLKKNNVEQVINNEAEYGISDSILILYRAKKQPVVIVSTIFQESPTVMLTLKDSGLNSPYKLNKKDVLFYPNDTDGFSILSMLKKLDIEPNLIRKREREDFKKLINKEVDAIPAYLSNEPFYFKKENIDVNIINPANYGIDLYGDMLFTNENEIKYYPERVKRFREASLKGWEYALNNKEEIINLIHTKYNKNKSLEHLKYEASVIEKLINKDTISLGSIDEGRIEYISNLYKEYELFSKSFDINNFIFNEYKKDSNEIFTKEELEYIKNKKVLKVQNMIAFPPYNFYNEKALGYTVDYMKLIAKKIGIDIEFISNKTWKENLKMLQNGEIDIIPQIAKNKERQKFISYTNFKHIDYQVSITTRKDSSVKSFEDLKNKKIAILNKSFLHTILKNKYPNQKLYLANTVLEGIEAVANGEADAIIDNIATVEYYKKENWLSNLKTIKINNIKDIPSKEPLYMGVSKDNLILKSILEKAHLLVSYSDNLKLKDKWFNTKENINFTDKEYRYLKSKKNISMCIDPNWMPFEKIEKGKHIGMTAEYINILEKAINKKIQLIKTNNWLESIEYGKNRKCDFITLMMNTKEREKYFSFSKKLMKLPLVIATKQDKPFINDINNFLSKKFAIVKDFAYRDLLKDKYPNINIINVKNIKEGLNKVDNNEIYGFIDVLPVIGFNIQENFSSNLKIAGKLDEMISFSMAIRNDEPELTSILNKGINSIPEDKNKEILNKWLSIKYEKGTDYKSLIITVFVFIVITLIIIIRNRSINKINSRITAINKKLSTYIDVVDKHVLTSTTDSDGVIIEVSQAFCDISEYTKKELIGKKHSVIKHEDMPDELFVDLWNTISNGMIWSGEIKNKKKSGGYYWVKATISPIFDGSGKITGYTAIRHDISDKKRIEEISITDELTTLYNKRYFNEIFIKELNRAKRENLRFALIILDVDFFKQYNDLYGHQKGDYVLEAIGKELKSICKRSTDIPFRIGGEEFGVIFTPHFKENALDFADIINKRIESLEIEHKLNQASKYITASIGLYTDIGENLLTKEEIYNCADKALYKAKESGRNQFIVYKKSEEYND